MIKPTTLLKYAMDLLIDAESNYSDALAPVHIDYRESQGGAMSSIQALTAEENRAQFGHLDHRITQIEKSLNNFSASLGDIRDMMSVLVRSKEISIKMMSYSDTCD